MVLGFTLKNRCSSSYFQKGWSCKWLPDLEIRASIRVESRCTKARPTVCRPVCPGPPVRIRERGDEWSQRCYVRSPDVPELCLQTRYCIQCARHFVSDTAILHWCSQSVMPVFQSPCGAGSLPPLGPHPALPPAGHHVHSLSKSMYSERSPPGACDVLRPLDRSESQAGGIVFFFCKCKK